MARDVNFELRIFAGNHVTVAEGAPLARVDRTEFRYYVIDPDLAGFPGTWTPSVEVVGRAPIGNVTDGETYQGAISVNELGTAYLTFTRSGPHHPAGWPSLARARLSADYTTTLYEQSGQQGPVAMWVQPGGALAKNLGLDYADIQPDPLHCGFLAVGALVADTTDVAYPPASEGRAVWVTEIAIPCNSNAEMNGDGVVDESDLALYLEYYSTGDQRADMDRSGTITSADYLKYAGEYEKRSR